MSARCSPGDLAIVIDAFNTENIGLCVTVIRPYEYEIDDTLREMPYRRSQGRTIWVVSAPREMKWNHSHSGKICYATIGPVPDDQLQPIKPPSEMIADRRALELEELRP
jgi:hypothetical protein